MRLDLFSPGDSVLLLGEGNFSFAVCLHKHKLDINITATCFEKEVLSKEQQENLKYLKSKEVQFFFNVDATDLHNRYRGNYFSKIVFNFPHIGGKMKIHLNRQLLRRFFESASQILEKNGLIIVSLCQGQGGTLADEPQRRWDDSWQIVEMAAHGDCILTAVEPFDDKNFQDYHCIGYRSQNVSFNLKGALVHVFAKEKPPYSSFSENTAIERLNLVPFEGITTVFAPVIYSELYKSNPMLNSSSPIYFLYDMLLQNLKTILPNTEFKILGDANVSIYVKYQNDIPCSVNNNCNQYTLRYDAVQVFDQVLQTIDNACQITIFPGMYFNPLGEDFISQPPLNFQFLIIGNDQFNLESKISQYLFNLSQIFGKENFEFSKTKLSSIQNYGNTYSINWANHLVFDNKPEEKSLIAVKKYSIKYNTMNIEACNIYANSVCGYFFKSKNWREIWTEKTKVVIDAKKVPILKQNLLYPRTYIFDITLKYNSNAEYSQKKMYQILWLAAGQFIEDVKLINHYISGKGWSSKCYRITYTPFGKAFYKKRVIEIHSKLVGRMLELGLDVIIS